MIESEADTAKRSDPYKGKSWQELRDVIADYESAICYGVPCTNCAKLLDKLYAAEVELETLKRGNTGHGHVYPRADGVRMRCGGPSMCRECAKDFVKKNKGLLDEI